MATELELVNAALLRVGSETITAGEFATPLEERAVAVDAFWPIARRSVLREHPWNAVTKRDTLTVDGTAPEWDYTTRFAVPANTLRILNVNVTGPWRVEAGYILCDEADDLEIVFIEDDNDPSAFDSMLTEALILKLAIMLCERITDSSTKRERLLDEYQQVMRDVKHIEGQEKSENEFEEDLWITARY